mmetsp:Transcript_32995/g.83265  ORF Transcript_32995/g.83265 Transcript_32995/m.83265 type:complete len:269 (+) Transcript_32995:82-888(+)
MASARQGVDVLIDEDEEDTDSSGEEQDASVLNAEGEAAGAYEPHIQGDGFYRGHKDGSTTAGRDTFNNVAALAPKEKPPWRTLLEDAKKRNRSEITASYCQLATIREDGTPANRTIVFRGFEPGSHSLYFVTDSRSEKVKHAAKNPAAEIAWYMTVSREQFRLSGEIRMITPKYDERSTQGKLRMRAWADLSDNARAGFEWPDPGSHPVCDSSVFESAEASKEVASKNFILCCLDVTRVEYLNLRGTPQKRIYFSKQGGQWTSLQTNP